MAKAESIRIAKSRFLMAVLRAGVAAPLKDQWLNEKVSRFNTGTVEVIRSSTEGDEAWTKTGLDFRVQVSR
ncbi:hypothetical protein COLO4_21985 [Corchorus olitorius]|uniref:Uncharacterized protein n=1 Tax=Corchorus olitorius TaxID=93759 RepID=A0A1R3IPK9_9ROSI|nr:hypothetical protein COLO4_21985 [Corchorus olitorius]